MRWAPAATRFTAYAPNFPTFRPFVHFILSEYSTVGSVNVVRAGAQRFGCRGRFMASGAHTRRVSLESLLKPMSAPPRKSGERGDPVTSVKAGEQFRQSEISCTHAMGWASVFQSYHDVIDRMDYGTTGSRISIAEITHMLRVAKLRHISDLEASSTKVWMSCLAHVLSISAKPAPAPRDLSLNPWYSVFIEIHVIKCSCLHIWEQSTVFL